MARSEQQTLAEIRAESDQQERRKRADEKRERMRQSLRNSMRERRQEILKRGDQREIRALEDWDQYFLDMETFQEHGRLSSAPARSFLPTPRDEEARGGNFGLQRVHEMLQRIRELPFIDDPSEPPTRSPFPVPRPENRLPARPLFRDGVPDPFMNPGAPFENFNRKVIEAPTDTRVAHADTLTDASPEFVVAHRRKPHFEDRTTENSGAVIRGLIARGVPRHVAMGFAGNISQESLFDPSAVGDGGNAFGLFQHNGTRRKALEEFARGRKADPANIETQLDFAVHELNTTHRAARDAALRTQDAKSAAGVLSDKFFVAGKPNLANRQSQAAQFDLEWDRGESAPQQGGGGLLGKALAAAVAAYTGGAGGGGGGVNPSIPAQTPQSAGAIRAASSAAAPTDDGSADPFTQLQPLPDPGPPQSAAPPPQRPSPAPQQAPQPSPRPVLSIDTNRAVAAFNRGERNSVPRRDLLQLMLALGKR